MEKIQQAIEKARRDGAVRHWAAREDISRYDTLTRPQRESDGVLVIEYRHTRVVPVSPKMLRRRRVVATDEGSRHAEAFRVLRTQLLSRLEASGGRAIAVC